MGSPEPASPRTETAVLPTIEPTSESPATVEVSQRLKQFSLFAAMGPMLTFLVIVTFIFACFCLFWRRDFSTALEMTLVVWFLALMKAACEICAFYRGIATPRPQANPSWDLARCFTMCFIEATPALLIASLLSASLIFGYRRPISAYTSPATQWGLIVILIAFLALAFAFFVPLVWVFFTIA